MPSPPTRDRSGLCTTEMPGYSDEAALYDDPSYYLCNDTPQVTRITVDEDGGAITVEGKHFDRITWVSNGNVIRREEDVTSGTATLDLNANDLLNTPELYVRFYITGPYGICYAQPFVIRRAGASFSPVHVPKTRDLSVFLRGLVTVLDWAIFKWSPVVWVFKYFALGYDPLPRLWQDLAGIEFGLLR